MLSSAFTAGDGGDMLPATLAWCAAHLHAQTLLIYKRPCKMLLAAGADRRPLWLLLVLLWTCLRQLHHHQQLLA